MNGLNSGAALRRSARFMASNAAKSWHGRVVTRGIMLGLTSLAAACAQQAPMPDAALIVSNIATSQPVAEMQREVEPQPVVARSPAMRPVGRPQLGKASYYGPEFTGRTMANGRRFDPGSTSVAHRTLPLGTKVLVRNLDNGRVTTATVEDRGPFIQGRIIDVSPRLAERLGMLRVGVVPVEVLPVEVAEAP
ncbi:septal ring lytic transglycosylase RlpA family protein [Roseicella frigidaeris]|nr:septal ring lytic transglycosylase RlpA family protein [Roseicella frigidaeris]